LEATITCDGTPWRTSDWNLIALYGSTSFSGKSPQTYKATQRSGHGGGLSPLPSAVRLVGSLSLSLYVCLSLCSLSLSLSLSLSVCLSLSVYSLPGITTMMSCGATPGNRARMAPTTCSIIAGRASRALGNCSRYTHAAGCVPTTKHPHGKGLKGSEQRG
jgi:hypothetical protein